MSWLSRVLLKLIQGADQTPPAPGAPTLALQAPLGSPATGTPPDFQEPLAGAPDSSVIPDAALTLVESYEGFSPTAYHDPVGVPTIGYGSTRDWRIKGEPPVTMQTPEVTEEVAGQFVRWELMEAYRTLKSSVGPKLTTGQTVACLDFIYNLGGGAFRSSTLLKMINAGNLSGAADEFVKWDHAGGQVMAGLLRRRVTERDLFNNLNGDRA